MSKRAEEAALKAYPVNRIIHRGPDADNEIIYDSNEELRRGCIKGYKLAEKDLGWHSVDECLPPIDEEVIALSDTATSGKKLPWADRICFAHIVDTNIAVDYNGWNIPGVKYWMPCPKIPEQ